MGIGDRDYMKRQPEDDDRQSAYDSGNPKLAEWLSGFLRRFPRIGLWLAVVLAVIILAALIIARLSR